MDEPVIRRYMPITQKALEKTLCAHSVYAHVHIVFIIFTLSPSALSIGVGCVNIMYYVSRIIQFIIYQFRHTDINNYIIRTHPPLTAAVRCVSESRLAVSPGEKAKWGSREKYIYQKFNRAAILFMRVYVCQGDEKRRKHLFAYIENSATLRDLAKRYYYTGGCSVV